MKVEYVTSRLGTGSELHISNEEYKRVHSEENFDVENLMFAVKSYLSFSQCVNRISHRDVEEAFRHIKKSGTIILATKSTEMRNWCEVYAVTEGEIIPVIYSDNGIDFQINKSQKTKREIMRIRKRTEEDNNE